MIAKLTRLGVGILALLGVLVATAAGAAENEPRIEQRGSVELTAEELAALRAAAKQAGLDALVLAISRVGDAQYPYPIIQARAAERGRLSQGGVCGGRVQVFTGGGDYWLRIEEEDVRYVVLDVRSSTECAEAARLRPWIEISGDISDFQMTAVLAAVRSLVRGHDKTPIRSITTYESNVTPVDRITSRPAAPPMLLLTAIVRFEDRDNTEAYLSFIDGKWGMLSVRTTPAER